MECNKDSVLFETVKEAMHNSNITLTTNDVTSLLIWRDLISPIIKYNKIRPWQIINRIPFSNILCLKVPLSIILRDGQTISPSYINFIPETFILPDEFDQFEKEINKVKEKAEEEAKLQHKTKEKSPKTEKNENFNFDSDDSSEGQYEVKDEFFIKPSNGSLGNGIKILKTGEIFDKNSYINFSYKKSKPPTANPELQESTQCPAVAQRYIKSHLIGNTKFDLRIYVLISSVEPFEIFVYRDGLARFCSVQSHVDSIFARITNVTMNKRSFFCKEAEQISRLISDVFDENFSKNQQDKIWSEIDDLIVLTFFCSHRYLKEGQRRFVPNYYRKSDDGLNFFYSKNFQIFGFDILLREGDLKPFLIEVNYRPSLEFLRNCERRMKVDMIAGALKIAAPYVPFQKLVKARQWSWSLTLWEEELNSHPELFVKSFELKNEAIEESKYERIWPFDQKKIDGNPNKHADFLDILKKLDQLPINNNLIKI